MKELIARLGSRISEHVLQRPWFAVTAIVLLALPVFFHGLGSWSFLDPDEGRYGTIPYQMLERADFVTPRQNEVKFFDKPPLLYWAVAASYAVFGYREWAARLVPAVAALAGLLIVYGLGKRMFSPRAGVLGAVILATSFMWPVMARIVMTDMLVSVLVVAALAFWWLGHSENPDATQRRQTWYFIGFWLALALATLAKGPVALVLTGGCLFLYMLSCRQWHALKEMRWGIGVPLLVLVAAPWFVVVAQRNPEFNHFFWYDQHIGRFLGNTTGNDHVEGVGYYFRMLPLMLFPWSLFAPAAAIAGWNALRNIAREKPDARQRAAVYLLCGVFFTLLFFSASAGKLPTYVLPIVPLAALLLAAYFDSFLARSTEWNRALSWGVAVLAVLLTIGGVAVFAMAPARLRALGVDGGSANALGVTLVVWAVGLVVLSRRFRVPGTIFGTAGGFILMVVTALPLITAVTSRLTTASLVEYIRPGLVDPRSEIVTIDYIRSLSFYTRRRIKIVGVPDELKFGVQHMPLAERRTWVLNKANDGAALRREMSKPYPVYCFVRASRRNQDKVAELMRQIRRSASVIVANERFLVLGNRAARAATPPQPNAPML